LFITDSKRNGKPNSKRGPVTKWLANLPWDKVAGKLALAKVVAKWCRHQLLCQQMHADYEDPVCPAVALGS
jgi:hypothetical protein